MGQLDVGGQRGIDRCMQANVVAGMDEPRLSGSDTTGKADSIVQELMGVMGLSHAQGIDHQRIGTFDIWSVI